MEESKSTEEQNLQSEATVSSVSKILPLNSSDDCGENKKNCEQNWVYNGLKDLNKKIVRFAWKEVR